MNTDTSSTLMHQPAREIAPGKYFTQQTGGNQKWQELDHPQLIERLETDPPAFRTVLAITSEDDEGKPETLQGSFYTDFDGDLEETCEKLREFLSKLVALGVSLDQIRMYASGGRGFHVEVPQACFTVEPSPVEQLHRIYKEMAMSLFVDTLDLRVYSCKRMWRTPNVQRENGLCKVPLTPSEALEITPETYAGLCSQPRPHPELVAPQLVPELALMFAQARSKVFKSQARAKLARTSQVEFQKATGGQVPPTITALMAGAISPRDGIGWNQIALQLALVAHALDLSEDDLVTRTAGLIARHQGDSSRYATPSSRERELRNQYRYTAENAAYDVSVPALLSILPPTAPADDLRDLVADVPDHGFSVADLMTGHGKTRRLRRDLDALVQLLIRDPRLEDLVFFDEFGPAAKARKGWREPMQIPSAPSEPGPINDDHIAAVRLWFAREWEIPVPKELGFDVAMAWARQDIRNSVQDVLNAFEAGWDGEARLDSWLIDHAHAITVEDDVDYTPLIRAVGTKWLISAVARVFRPGCQADVALILTGPQGYRKSSLFRALGEALGKEAFADGFSLDGDHKAAMERLRGRVIVEWAEMTGLSKRDVREVKNFLTQRDDAYRASYERISRKWPRTAVIGGTANERELLADPTGGRRFWIVEVGQQITRPELAEFEKLLPQIWGEAVHRFKRGETWWLDPTEDAQLHAMAVDRQEADTVVTQFDELARRAAELIVIDDALARRHLNDVDTAAWIQVLELQALMTEINGGKGFSSMEWRQMITALKNQGWEIRKRTKARTMYYRVGEALAARVEQGV